MACIRVDFVVSLRGIFFCHPLACALRTPPRTAKKYAHCKICALHPESEMENLRWSILFNIYVFFALLKKSCSNQTSQRWDYEEFEQGEAVLGRLKWLEKGKEGLLQELSEELDTLEGGTIQQVMTVFTVHLSLGLRSHARL